MRDLKELNGLTNAKISEESGVSIKTIERLMAGNADQDIMRDTARRIENVIIGSSNTYPCYLAFEEEQAAKNENEPQLAELMRELERALADNGEYRGILDGIHTSYKAEMEIVRSEAQQKIDFLLTQLAAVRADNERLWAENNRKSKMIDIFIENKTGWLISEKE